jgi:hypothetical protein
MAWRTFRRGSTLIACTIVLVVVSTMAVALAALSGDNLEIADRQSEGNQAFANTESGLEVMHYWLGRVRVPSTTPPSDYLSTVIAGVQDDLATNGISNFQVNADGSIPAVALATVGQQGFQGQWSANASDPTILRVTAAGHSGTAARTITVDYQIAPYRFPIFNYGLATKGALRFPQNPTMTAANQGWEADMYVQSDNDLVAVEVGGNANFAGNIDIGNSEASVDFQGGVNIAGDTGQTAIDNHVNVGADPVEFPVPDVAHFRTYATGPVLDSTYTYSGTGMTLTNAVIAAGTNPTFSGLGAVTIQGILYIETPNIVTFAKNVVLQGLIVAEGDLGNLAANKIEFQANFSSSGYPSGTQFDAIRQEQGSSILAPGSAVSFTGNFSSVNGVLAAGSLYFSANASATVKGTLISYSTEPTLVEGNIALNFDRAAMVEIPAGFDLYRVLTYDPRSYTILY